MSTLRDPASFFMILLLFAAYSAFSKEVDGFPVRLHKLRAKLDG